MNRVGIARRSFLKVGTGLALGLVASFPARAQGHGKVLQIGVVLIDVPMAELAGRVPVDPRAIAFLAGLREAGWAEGDVRVHWKSAEGRYSRRPALFEELVRLPVDVLVTGGNASVKDALEKTRTVPVVSVGLTIPVQEGLVASIARPGGNVTGLMLDAGVEIEGKRLALLKQLAPGVTRVAYLLPWYARGDPNLVESAPETVAAAQSLGIKLFPSMFESADRIEEAIDAALRRGANGLFVGDWAPFGVKEIKERIARAAARSRMPAIYTILGAAEHGGLISYGTDPIARFRRAAHFVDRILKGARPAEMPLELAARYILEINLSAARALGLKVAPSLLTSADRVIE